MSNQRVLPARRRREPLGDSTLLMLVAIGFFVLVYSLSMIFLGEGFRRPARFFDLLNDNAYLIIISCGLTIVMITGSIDISVGGIVGCVAMFGAKFLSGDIFPSESMTPEMRIALAVVFSILIGLIFGAVHGALIAYLDIQPFIVTLAGMFFARGLTTMISGANIRLAEKAPKAVTDILGRRIEVWLGEISYKGLGSKKTEIHVMTYIEYIVIVAIVIVVLIALMLRKSRMGRDFYAVGGNRQSALMLGVNVRRTRFMAHLISGLLAGIAGFVYLWHTKGAQIAGATQAEMQAIASSIIGGTLLTGGVGHVAGTIFGVLIIALIKPIILDAQLLKGFEWLKEAWWQEIFNGGVLCLFIVMQSVLLKVRGIRSVRRNERLDALQE